MQLIWRGILLFDFRLLARFWRKDSLQTLHMSLMMRVVILLGALRDLTSWVSGQLIYCSEYYRFFIVVPSSINFLVIRYGDMPAHNLLWRECEKSSDDVAARLAVIPLVQVMFCSEYII